MSGTFGEWLRIQMIRSGKRAADIARETGLDASLVSKWTRDQALPTLGNLRRLAPALGVSFTEAAARAGHIDYDEVGATDPGEPEELPPMLAELSLLLDPRGPMPDDERASLTTLIESAIRPYRRHLRGRRAG